ncbi:glycoside hydrolase family 10 protein [Micromonospora sp. CB01531]|uniref:glycoside hydrolase family 10 protein n=1 Tax=Micromonospora sp. CB01531 TaxID=1718947 RepID=UPI00093F4DBB|nr:family 10 glycosylhydrolase [Micromonospora sp. CB01531]OKI74179.1 glycosyl hydrolase [Micromonospora sp. CB01531]
MPAAAPPAPRFRRRRTQTLVAVVVSLAVAVALGAWSLHGRVAGGGALEQGDVAASGTPICAGRPARAPRELRGMWITTVNNIDWPSRPGLPAEKVRAEFRSWLDLAVRRNHNAVFVHVRPSGDALWPSRYAPWSQWLTGSRDGRDPGWDPMEFMVAEAHARNLEFHAWFNPYRGGQPATVGGPGPRLDQLAPTHPLRRHPDWVVTYPSADRPGSRLYFNPGVPEARKFVEDSMLEAVQRYDVDGVHFDDFFYPYPEAGQDFPDGAAFARYGRGFADKADWRRDNVNTLVREMSERIKAIKPWVKFGISPFGIWRNKRTDPAGSATAGLQSYDDIYADTRLWVREQWLDYVVPQLYWHIGFGKADYAKLLPWWAATVRGTRVQLYIGQADYRVGERGAWRDPAELDRQLALNQRHGVNGSVHFSAKQVRADKLGAVSRYSEAHYVGPALVPTMAQLPAAPPAAPEVTDVRRADGGVVLTWRGKGAASFAVYRVDAEVARLIGSARGGGWVDRAAPAGRSLSYCVSGLDRSGNEGRLSTPVSVAA